MRQVSKDIAIWIGLGGDTGLALSVLKASHPCGDPPLQAAQAAAAVGHHKVVEGIGLDMHDELFGVLAIYVQGHPVVLDLWARPAQWGPVVGYSGLAPLRPLAEH